MPRVKTCVKAGPGAVEVIERDLPDPGPGQVLIRTALTTVCGSDLHMVDDFATLPAGTPQGHEAVGVIEAVGDGVERLRAGDRVVSSCLVSCGQCPLCLAGDPCMCQTYHAPFNVLFGCQAEAFLVSSADLNVTHIPADLTDAQALLTSDIMSTGFAAIERGKLQPGQSVAIFAQGPVGLCATAAARFHRAGRIIAVESVPERAAMALRLGADEVVPAAGAVERIRELTRGHGVDLAVEALGREETFAACLGVVRSGGTVSSVGVYAGVSELKLPINAVTFHFTLVTSYCPAGTARLEYLMGLQQRGQIDLSALWTHRRRLADMNETYALFRRRADGVIKVAISP